MSQVKWLEEFLDNKATSAEDKIALEGILKTLKKVEENPGPLDIFLQNQYAAGMGQ